MQRKLHISKRRRPFATGLGLGSVTRESGALRNKGRGSGTRDKQSIIPSYTQHFSCEMYVSERLITQFEG